MLLQPPAAAAASAQNTTIAARFRRFLIIPFPHNWANRHESLGVAVESPFVIAIRCQRGVVGGQEPAVRLPNLAETWPNDGCLLTALVANPAGAATGMKCLGVRQSGLTIGKIGLVDAMLAIQTIGTTRIILIIASSVKVVTLQRKTRWRGDSVEPPARKRDQNGQKSGRSDSICRLRRVCGRQYRKESKALPALGVQPPLWSAAIHRRFSPLCGP